jgi:hypothetical protein
VLGETEAIVGEVGQPGFGGDAGQIVAESRKRSVAAWRNGLARFLPVFPKVLRMGAVLSESGG